MPILALGDDVATKVTGGAIRKSRYRVMEEQPEQTTAVIVDFKNSNSLIVKSNHRPKSCRWQGHRVNDQ